MARARVAQAFCLPALLITTLLSVAPQVAAAPACEDQQPNGPAAVRMAERCDRPVEIADQRTEISQTFAKPEGGFRLERSMEPRWARKQDGSWTEVDTDLQSTSGFVKPKASVLPVEFSAGGTGPAARLRDGARELSITWPLGALPKPVLSGSDATYVEVLPGVDLKLTASALGFSEVLVVKTREAAKNPKLAQVKFGFATKNVVAATTGTGGLEAKDGQGRVVFTSPTPLMWDSTLAQQPAPQSASVSAQAAAPQDTRPVTMPVLVENGELTVTPDAKMMSDEATKFPVFIDPSWEGRLYNNDWTLVTDKPGKANQAFWRGGNFLQDANIAGAMGTGRVCDSSDADGNCIGTPYNVRSYLRMDTSGVGGKTVTKASFRVRQLWAWSCRPGSDAVLRVTNEIGTGTTWNAQPGWWDDAWASSTPANRRLDMKSGCDGAGELEFDVTRVVGAAASGNWSYATMALHVRNEGDVKQWKRFDASSPLLSVEFNSAPNVPDQLSVNGKACTGTSFVPTATPTLAARVGDPDPQTMKARFEWARMRDDNSRAEVGEVTELGGFGNGANAHYTLPVLPAPLDKTGGVLDRSDKIVGTGDWNNDGRADVLSRDGGGYLYLFPGDGTKLGNRVRIGVGWNGLTIAGAVDWDGDGKRDLIARNDANGELLVYPGEGRGDGPSTQSPSLIGVGFNGYQFGGLADFDKDGKQDLIAKDWNGELWLYPGEGKRSPSSQGRVRIGVGFGAYTIYGVIDRTGDGAPDIIAESDDLLWLYLGSGKRAPFAGEPFRHNIGSGWAGAQAMTTPDFNGDGAPDLIARTRFTTTLWHMYPGVVGTGPGGGQKPVAGVGLTSGGVYAFRVAAGDDLSWSGYSDWCKFTVDTEKPELPTVRSTVYKPTGCPSAGCGSLGVADTFTFTSRSKDVTKFRWGFTDPPTMSVPAAETADGTTASVRWTPPAGGPKTLYVDALDRAGLHAEKLVKYQFTVAEPTPNVGRWAHGADPLADTSGSGRRLVVNAVSTGQEGRLVGGDNALFFDGMRDSSATTAKVLDTSKSFSVSAWVRLGGDTVNHTVVSQQGNATSAFRLGYDVNSRKWAFSVAESDTANPVQRTALADAPARTLVWTHLTGVYDTATREVKLHVDGALQHSIATVNGGFDAAGGLWIGSRKENGAAVEQFVGGVADVRVWGRAITPDEVAVQVDPTKSSGVGTWRFDEGSGDVALDSSPFAHDLTLTLNRGASWGEGAPDSPDLPGGSRSGLVLDGTGTAQSNEPVINTDQSFSIDVWVKLAEAGAPRTVVVQGGTNNRAEPFSLGYDGAKWTVAISNGTNDPSTWWRVSSRNDASVQTWTRLRVNYDAVAQTLGLWVGDDLQGTATGVQGRNSLGVLTVGHSDLGGYWYGGIDELRIHQTTLRPAVLKTNAPEGASISGDARAEIISVDADGGVRAFLNENGTYPGLPKRIGSGWDAARTGFADLDADGRTEMIAIDADGTIRAFRNLSGMTDFPFGDMYTIGKAASGDPVRTRFADLDGDGRADRVSIDVDGRVRAYRNLFGLNGLGQSQAFATDPVEMTVTAVSPDRIRFADVDGDHRAELVMISHDGTVLSYRNTAGFAYGTYDEYREIGYDWTPDRTWFANIDGDRRQEMVTARADGGVWSFPNVNNPPAIPFSTGVQIGSAWYEPARIFFG